MENSRKILVRNNTWLHVEMHTKSIAIAYLYNADNNMNIKIPNDFKVFDLTNNIELKKIPDSETFALCGTDNYSFRYNNKEITNTLVQNLN